MILVIEKEKLDFSKAQTDALLTLTSKDQIYLVTKKGDTIPVEIIPIISKINAKLEIKQLSDENSLFEKGFLYGALSRSGGKDKVVILSSQKAPETLDANCSWNEGFGVPAPVRAKKSAAKDLFSTAAFRSVSALVGDKRDAFRNCLISASDGEIGFKMLLDVNFGREEGDKIWEKTKDHFEELQKLAQK
ncbi:MAG: hypothetical protein IKS85_09740 [Lachnospiraceae bacterium]|nr:hypothetical protein [Lachnospiraceae bacterium]